MKIVLIGNVGNGIGLQRDAELLFAFLESRGHTVATQDYEQPAGATGFDLAIFLETISEHLVSMASRAWLIANPEWLKPEFIRPIQRHCSLVLAKTRDAERILREHFSHVAYIGFLTSDKRDATIARTPQCLHIGGNSGYRGTNAVIAAYREYRYWDSVRLPPLTVVSNSKMTATPDSIPGVTFIKRATDEDITRLQNQCLFHLQPSAYEGWGHAIHESQSVGAVLLTTHADPMTELRAPVEVDPYATKKACLATLHEVHPRDLRVAVSKLVTLPNYEIAQMQVEARARFEKNNREFTARFDALLQPEEVMPSAAHDGMSMSAVSIQTIRAVTGVASVQTRALRIAMLGNFHPPHSTENDLAWTLRDMGHTVLQFQENEDTTEEILSGSQGCQLFLYIHTHGWSTPGRLTLDDLINRLRDAGTITSSFHLDRYWGLNVNDKREDRIGQHPFWHTAHVFTADGGNQQKFGARGIAHYWLPPAVCKRDVHAGTRRDDLAIDVGFVGAESYHPEYPFRGELISFLRATYGSRFRVFTGFRGAPLNDLYASVRVVVGDSCFGGADFYWSDRVPETLGRGGFLIHPATRGLDIPGLVTFPPGDLLALADRIDYYLAHDSEREHLRCAAHHWVREHETYTNRMTTLLRTVGLQ